MNTFCRIILVPAESGPVFDAVSTMTMRMMQQNLHLRV
ncbi:hypothetical protein ARZXY2_4174 [Arthrobacter sp. ZXY-2]|nr:hypothetical protein ARZXY2_4174 [Arthrobacter sp. ZXY-2]